LQTPPNWLTRNFGEREERTGMGLRQRGGWWLRPLEVLIGVGLLGSAVRLVVVLVAGPHHFAIGSLDLGSVDLRHPLLSFLYFALLAAFTFAARRGVPPGVRMRSPLVLFLAVLLVYSLSTATAPEGDSTPARYLPLSILREHNFDLDEFEFLYKGRQPFFLVESNGHMVSTYPPWAAVFALPIYLLPVLGGIQAGSSLVFELEKLAAGVITALSVVVLYAALRRLTRERVAWAVALVYALGTSSFSTSSQALWQHGPAQLCIAVGLYCLIRGQAEPRFTSLAGFPFAAAILCRPTSALIVLPIGVYLLHRARDRIVGFVCAGLPLLAVLLAYNRAYFGSVATFGFGGFVFGQGPEATDAAGLFDKPLLAGVAGVLVSPGRGLFVYSPIFILSLAGIVMVWRRPGEELLKYLSLAPVPLILLTAKWINWFGGWCYGPRLLAELTPVLCLFLVPPFERCAGSRPLAAVAIGLSALSILLHALGAFADQSWNLRLIPGRLGFHEEVLWQWRTSPPVYNAQRWLDWVTGKPPRATGSAMREPGVRRRRRRRPPGSASSAALAVAPAEAVWGSERGCPPPREPIPI